MPLYLYYNDIVADWHRLFRPIFSLCSKCAVVDDDLNICGTVDAINALAATPSRKISSLYSAGGGCFVTDEDTSMTVTGVGDSRVSISLGATFFEPGDGKTFENLYRESDDALYQAKRGGKAQYFFFEIPRPQPGEE